MFESHTNLLKKEFQDSQPSARVTKGSLSLPKKSIFSAKITIHSKEGKIMKIFEVWCPKNVGNLSFKTRK